LQGTLIWFNPDKRHGFIRTEDGERLLVEEEGFEPGHLLGDRCAGTKVAFERVEIDADEPRAVHVTVVPMDAARRARRRR
jgi:cold shock CspA family protein